MTAASTLADVLRPHLGEPIPVHLTAWDGSTAGSAEGIPVEVTSPSALRRLAWHPGELGFAQAYVTGEIRVSTDLVDALTHLRTVAASRHVRMPGPLAVLRALPAARRLGVLGTAPSPPVTQVRIGGRLHSRTRDSRVIGHHYDLSNDFYALLLDDTMSYSCGYWTREEPGYGLLEAQLDKAALVCRKLDLEPGMRLLDVGCGWGALSLYAAEHHGVTVTGVTISAQQKDFVDRRIAERGLGDRVEVRLQDYRDAVPAAGEEYDAVASIEMGEHVGRRNYPVYLSVLRRSVKPGGSVLVQQMSRRGRHPGGGPFIEAFIAPDMHMRPVARTLERIETAGLEIRDVQALREHYVRTVQAWRETFDQRRPALRELVGDEALRVWELYLAGGMLAFRDGRMGVDQILARRPGAPSGARTRSAAR